MLINEDRALQGTLLSTALSRGRIAGRLRKGVYQIHHFGSSHFLKPDYEHYPKGLEVYPYGVCDSVEQLLEKCPSLENDPNREFVVTVTAIIKEEQPQSGGWRWHKWGPYIGTQNPQHEYLYDEENIDQVYVYSIYERITEHTRSMYDF